MHRMHRLASLIFPTVLALAASARTADASLIRSSEPHKFPDVTAADATSVGNVQYTANSDGSGGLFQVAATPRFLTANDTQELPITANSNGLRQQIINLALDKNGALVGGDARNSYVLTGTITTDGQTFSGVLLQGTPLNFGSQDLSPLGLANHSAFDLDVKVTGGALAQYFGDTAYVFISADQNSTFNGHFDTNFSGGKITTNTIALQAPQPFPIPEPTTCLIVLVGGAGLVHRHRRRLAGRR